MTEPGGPFTLTHQDLARIVGVSVTTIKSYRRKFPEFFFPPSQTKPLRFRPETEKLCLKIADLFARGWSIKRARQELTRLFPAIPVSDKLPISATASPDSGTSGAQLDRVLFLLDQMNKGLGAMATAQARTAMEAPKERSRMDALLAQQAALTERLDALAQRLDLLLPSPLLHDLANRQANDSFYSSEAQFHSGQALPIDSRTVSAQQGTTNQNPQKRSDSTSGPFSDRAPEEPEPTGGQASTSHAESKPDPRPQPPATPFHSRRVIHVQGKTGTLAYEFSGDHPNSQASQDPAATRGQPGAPRRDHLADNGTTGFPPFGAPETTPPSTRSSQDEVLRPDFLHLPVVLRSSRGEYLGLTGRTGQPFSLAELEHYLGQRPDLKPMNEIWKGASDQWTLNLHSPDSDTGWHSFHFTRTQTPKGNHVALLTRLDLDSKPVTEAFLQAFFRQIKEALT